MVVPQSLRTWFVIHFALDILFAIPLLLFPASFLQLFGFSGVEVVTARLVGAALVGIGGTSLIVKNESKAVFGALLTLKLLWSGAAVFGFLLSLAQGAPQSTWLFMAIFAGFFCLWMYYKRQI